MFWKHIMKDHIGAECTVKLDPTIKMTNVVNYDEKLAQARETLKQMGIDEIRPMIGLKNNRCEE